MKRQPMHGMGENICKSCDWQGVNIQNMQTAETMSKKQADQSKSGHTFFQNHFEQAFFQRIHTDG